MCHKIHGKMIEAPNLEELDGIQQFLDSFEHELDLFKAGSPSAGIAVRCERLVPGTQTNGLGHLLSQEVCGGRAPRIIAAVAHLKFRGR